MLTKNQILELTVDSFGSDAQGVCRANGMAVFVPGALPGERVRVRIVKPMKSYAFGRLEEILIPSSDRRDPPCPIYKRCGGCAAQHMRYEATLAFKRDQVRDLLRRVGGIDIDVPSVIGMDNPWHYRNKGAYPVALVNGKPCAGFFAERSHDLIALPEGGCAIQRGDANRAVETVIRWMRTYDVAPYDERAHRGIVRHVVTRITRAGGVMTVVVANAKKLPHEAELVAQLKKEVPQLESVVLSVNDRRTNVILGTQLHTLYGHATMTDTLCGYTFQVSPLSFFQVNPEQTEKLYALAVEWAQLDGAQTVVDAYCGAGTISLLLARHAKHVTGIEIVPEAIADAKENAARNGVSNVEFICGAAEELLPARLKEGLRPDVVVVDPPRKGCDAALLRALIDVQPQRIVYVSCNPATLARDAGILTREGGYVAERVQSVDMFCWTGGVETVMSLVQQKPDDIVKIGIDADELAVTKAESKATYGEIQTRVKEQTGLNVTPLYIAQVKRKHGILSRECYNKAKSENAKMLICPPDKEKAIEEALRFFGMIA